MRRRVINYKHTLHCGASLASLCRRSGPCLGFSLRLLGVAVLARHRVTLTRTLTLASLTSPAPRRVVVADDDGVNVVAKGDHPR